MKIIGRFKIEGGSSGYQLDDGGLVYGVTERGLYDEDILSALVEAGYKIRDYHGNIETPDGISIKDITETPCTASVDEIQSMIDMASLAMSEAEATKYFTRVLTLAEIKFKEPKVLIKTREELKAYLDKCRRMLQKRSSLKDFKPINSFVAREALFEIEELVKDESVQEYMEIIADRRRIKSYAEYRLLIRFLQAEGVLGDSYTPDDVKTAYLAWGIDGIKTPVTGQHTKLGVVTTISDVTDGARSEMKYAGRVFEYCLLDKNGVIHYNGGQCDLSDSNEFENEEVMPVVEREYYTLLNRTSEWVTDFKPIKCLVRRPTNRTTYDLLDNNGVSYSVRVDVSNIAFIVAGRFFRSYQNLYIQTLDGSHVSLVNINSELDYAEYNLTRAKAKDLIHRKTVKIPVSNSYELAIAEGLSPEAAVRYIARQLTYNENVDDGVDYKDAHILYRSGPSKPLIDKYNVNGTTYETLDELIDILCDARDMMIDQGTYLAYDEGDRSVQAAETLNEIATRPIEKLDFVKRAKAGLISVDKLARGILADGGDNITEIANMIKLVVDYQLGRLRNYSDLERMVRDIEKTDIINFNTIVGVRDAGYRGYLEDRASLNSERALQATELVYITRVFREVSNEPIEEQRHYMFECMHFSIHKEDKYQIEIQSEITEAIKTGVSGINGISDFTRRMLILEAASLGARLIFKIITRQSKFVDTAAGKVTTESITVEGKEYDVNIVISKETADELTSGGYTDTKYCTLYDWCDNEIDTQMAFNLYCVNANITPWRITPKPGFQIPVYNFPLNYMRIGTILKRYGEKAIMRMTEQKAKVCEIGKEYFNKCLITGLDMPVTEFTVSTINSVLSQEVDETPDLYMLRWNLFNKEIARHSPCEVLMRIPLKTDIVFKGYSEDAEINSEIATEQFDEEEAKKVRNYHLSKFEPTVASNKVQSTTRLAAGNTVEQFDLRHRSYDDIARWADLVCDTFEQKGVCIYMGGILNVSTAKGETDLTLSTLALQTAQQLVEKGLFYQLDATHFLLPCVNGYYELEVK